MPDECKSLQLSYVLEVPAQTESLHEFVTAYFRASANGPWWLDDEWPVKPQRVCFVRGNWFLSDRTGQRNPLPMLPSADDSFPRTRPAQLLASVEPLEPGLVRLHLRYRFLYPGREAQLEWLREQELPIWRRWTQTEVEGLSQYLCESLRLPRSPQLV